MVFTLSDASFLVRGNGAGIVYAAAKHAALGVVRQLAPTWRPRSGSTPWPRVGS
ncbi:hypothetical protein [Streptomyces antimycoticus]|uniref:hypothetical protein n=1 Tax=Streptomyces antimycoticus TaxID=68175 RepID=UPI0036CEBA79